MPSSYTASARFTLQATGENNNTWGVILNQGVFQLVDDAENGRLAISLSGAHTLTVNLGATDEARMKFIDVTGGSGGVLTAPSVPKAYFVHNGSSGIVGLSAGGATLNLNPGDATPVHTDGTTFYPVLIGGLTIQGYVAAQIAGSVINLPSVVGQAGKFLSTDGSVAFWSAPLVGFRNRIINGDMRIDQRRAGGNFVPATNVYSVDRWQAMATTGAFTVGQTAGGPPGFQYCLGASVTTAHAPAAGDYYAFAQTIEGFNIVDLGWGTASAQAVTVSFWAKSSVTGAFGGAVRNVPANRSYPFTYALLAANAWTFISLTIPGDTAGTWAANASGGLVLDFSMGAGATFSAVPGAWGAGNILSATGAVAISGTAGANFYLTGVQLEAGSAATPFERRPFATELFLCQRYYENNMPTGQAPGDGVAQDMMIAAAYAANGLACFVSFKVEKRVNPVMTFYKANSANPTNGQWGMFTNGATSDAGVPSVNRLGTKAITVVVNAVTIANASATGLLGGWVADAEL